MTDLKIGKTIANLLDVESGVEGVCHWFKKPERTSHWSDIEHLSNIEEELGLETNQLVNIVNSNLPISKEKGEVGLWNEWLQDIFSSEPLFLNIINLGESGYLDLNFWWGQVITTITTHVQDDNPGALYLALINFFTHWNDDLIDSGGNITQDDKDRWNLRCDNFDLPSWSKITF